MLSLPDRDQSDTMTYRDTQTIVRERRIGEGMHNYELREQHIGKLTRLSRL